MISAGEASGDLLGEGVARSLLASREIELIGIGGEGMRRAGVDTSIDIEQLSVMGLVEVIRHYPRLRRLLSEASHLLEKRRPAVLIAIDYPGFNLRLAAAARRLGIPVLFFVSPQVWAWRPGRIKRIGQLVDHMAVLFPFEETLYRQAGIAATFVGHPLIERYSGQPSKQTARQALQIDGDACCIGLLPGSRPAEIERHLPLLIDSARLLHQGDPARCFLIPRAPNLDRSTLDSMVAGSGLPIQVVDGNFTRAVVACDAVAVASGTATLEVGMTATPMVVFYRMAPLSFWLLRRMLTIDQVSLVNIVCGRPVVRELLQQAATAAAISTEVERLLGDLAYRSEQSAALTKIGSLLTPPDSLPPSARVAAIAIGMIDKQQQQ
jgi:lipid-A-disaccharide synthase